MFISQIEVRDAALEAMRAVGASIRNYEIGAVSTDLVASLVDAANDKQTDKVLDALLATSFIHAVDAPALALVTPIVRPEADVCKTHHHAEVDFTGHLAVTVLTGRYPDLGPWVRSNLASGSSVALTRVASERVLQSAGYFNGFCIRFNL